MTDQAFVLYGGTAIALYLGHRESVDFDFFTEQTFEPESLLAALSEPLKHRLVKASASVKSIPNVSVRSKTLSTRQPGTFSHR